MPDITKSGVRALVEAGDETAILALFDEDPHRVQRFLKRLAASTSCRGFCMIVGPSHKKPRQSTE